MTSARNGGLHRARRVALAAAALAGVIALGGCSHATRRYLESKMTASNQDAQQMMYGENSFRTARQRRQNASPLLFEHTSPAPYTPFTTTWPW